MAKPPHIQCFINKKIIFLLNLVIYKKIKVNKIKDLQVLEIQESFSIFSKVNKNKGLYILELGRFIYHFRIKVPYTAN